MSSPETNVDKQQRRHRGPLIGIAVLLIFSTIMGFLIFWEGTDGDRDDPLAPADAVAPAEGAAPADEVAPETTQ